MNGTEEPARESPVLRVDPTLDPNWDRDLSSCEGATFFHTSAWALTIKDTYGFEPAYFVTRRPGQVEAVLPMMDVKSWLTGKRGVSLPFTDECAPLGPDAATVARLFREAQAFASLRQWRYIECRGGLDLLAQNRPSQAFLGHRLNLSHGEAALFEGFEGAVRRAIRKAEQSGLSVEASTSLEAVREFYALFCKTRRRHGVPPQPFLFFSNLHKNVLGRGHGRIVVARHGGLPVAAAIFLHFRNTALYKFGASDVAFNHLRANNLVMWEAIRHYAGKGYDNLDFGRTSFTNPGLRRFKQSWGTMEHTINYMRQDCRTDGSWPVSDAASGWRTRLLRLLPGPAFRWAGSVLYKHTA